MKKALLALAMFLGITLGVAPNAVAEMTKVEAANMLQPSIGKLYRGSSYNCTAWKLYPKVWVTGKHCVGFTGSEFKIETNNKTMSKTLFARSVTMPLEKSVKKNHKEDWATILVSEETPDIPTLNLCCSFKVTVGEIVAYMGFPVEGGKATQLFSVGAVSSVNLFRSTPYHYAVDFQGGGGSSGSPVITLKTGEVVGFVTKGVVGSAGLIAVGIESVKGMDICELEAEESETEKEQETINDSF